MGSIVRRQLALSAGRTQGSQAVRLSARTRPASLMVDLPRQVTVDQVLGPSHFRSADGNLPVGQLTAQTVPKAYGASGSARLSGPSQLPSVLPVGAAGRVAQMAAVADGRQQASNRHAQKSMSHSKFGCLDSGGGLLSNKHPIKFNSVYD